MRRLLFLLVFMVIGCSTQPSGSDPAAQGAPAGVMTADAIVQFLQQTGIRVQPAAEIEQPFWTRRARVFTVEGDDLQLYEFPDESAAERAVREVAPGGGSIGSSAMSWIAPPHFYRSGRVIAIYLGTNPRVLDALRSHLGAPFAERS